jgi:HAAS
MTDADPIREYLDEFARQFSCRGRRARRVLCEIEEHLRDAAQELREQGIEPAAAAAKACERFGSPEEIWRQFDRSSLVDDEVMTMLRMTMTAVVVLTTIMAGLFFVFSWLGDAPPAVQAVKMLISAAIVGYNLLLLHQLWLARVQQALEDWCVFAGALLLVATGSAGIVWTAHLGQVTGDWEFYGFVIGGLLMAEGALATLQLLARSPLMLKSTA